MKNKFKSSVCLLLAALMLASFCSLCACSPESQKEENTVPPAGDATGFTIVDSTGANYSLYSFAGKPTVINFWAVGCSPCVAEFPDFQRVYDEYKDKINFVFIDVETDVQLGLNFVKDNNYTFPVYFDLTGLAQEFYSVDAYPTSVFVDKDGNTVDSQLGGLDYETIVGFIDNLLK